MRFTPCTTTSNPTLDKKECEELIVKYDNAVKKAGLSDKGEKNKSIRKTQAVGLKVQDEEEIYNKCIQTANLVNLETWGYELSSSDQIQFLKYNIGGHYNWHLDIGSGDHMYRKLSFVLPLSEPDSYEGGELVLKPNFQEKSIPLEQGKMIIFPSFILHKVTPVTSGTRYMLVGWLRGKLPFQ